MGRGQVIAEHLTSFLAQTPYPYALTAFIAATLAVLIDLICRFSAYRALLPSLSLSGIFKCLAAFSLVFLQVVALFYLVTLLPRFLMVLILLFFSFIIIIQLSYWKTLSQFMTGTDLFLAVTVSGDHRIEAILSFFKPRILMNVLPYALTLSILLLAPPISSFGMALALSLLPLLYLLVSNYILFLHLPERSFHLHPLTSFLRAILHCLFENLRQYRGPRDNLPAFHVSKRPLDSLIYVIDESVRGSNLSLNGYPRDTTPFLQSLEKRNRLSNFGICVAAASFTHVSNAYLISGHNEFPDNSFRTDKNPNIIDYAKQMGYETVYIDINQVCLYYLLRAAGKGPVRSLDQWMNDKSFKACDIDLAVTKDPGVARFLSSLLNKKTGYFILVNKKGLHFHYRNRYPDNMESTVWKPVMKASQSIDTSEAGREKLINTYDNGIRFQVDEFFRAFVSETANQNYAMLYTSDHGQTLSEHGQVYTHMKPDPEIVDVPNFIVSGENYSKQGLLDGISPGIRVSHLNNFATLLDMMGVPPSMRMHPYDKSIFELTAEDNKERYYMSGSLHGSGDYVVEKISTPPAAGWGVSRPAGNQTKS